MLALHELENNQDNAGDYFDEEEWCNMAWTKPEYTKRKVDAAGEYLANLGTAGAG
jgi:hypothetical protein